MRKFHRHNKHNEDAETVRRASAIIQLFKYGVVGALNTILTLIVIFLCKSMLDMNPDVANAIGYVAGVINSFLWNRAWVFKAGDGSISRQAVKFLVGFAVCYILQFGVVWVLNQSTFGDIRLDLAGFVLSGYGIATLIGMIVYTLSNFLFNRVVTFK